MKRGILVSAVAAVMCLVIPRTAHGHAYSLSQAWGNINLFYDGEPVLSFGGGYGAAAWNDEDQVTYEDCGDNCRIGYGLNNFGYTEFSPSEIHVAAEADETYGPGWSGGLGVASISYYALMGGAHQLDVYYDFFGHMEGWADSTGWFYALFGYDYFVYLNGEVMESVVWYPEISGSDMTDWRDENLTSLPLSMEVAGGDLVQISLHIRARAEAEQAVPEPATLLLFGTGLAGLGFIRRRKKI